MLYRCKQSLKAGKILVEFRDVWSILLSFQEWDKHFYNRTVILELEGS